MMPIKTGSIEDAAAVAPLILQAAPELFYAYLQREDEAEALRCLAACWRAKDNLYSHQNARVYWLDGNIIGVILAYDGAHFRDYRAQSLQLFQSHLIFNADEYETEAGEFYLDCVAVDEKARGRGVGSALLRAMTAYGLQQCPRVTLLVEPEKTEAQRLYQKLGFQKCGRKRIAHHDYLQFHIEAL